MFNEIIDQMDTLCRETAHTCKAAYDRLQAAESAASMKKQPGDSPVMFEAKRAAAAAELEEARKQHRSLSVNLPDDAAIKAKALRRQLEAAVSKEYAASPADIDADTLTLLRSGILQPAEYVRLYDSATTTTMRRLIGKAAGDAAPDAKTKDGERILRNVAIQAQRCNGGKYLEAFDGLTDILRRSAKNPAFEGLYEKLAAPYLEVFKA